MLPSIEPKSYQQVKWTLTWFLVLLLGLAVPAIYAWALLDNHREWLVRLVNQKALLAFGGLAPILLLWAWVSVSILKVHQVYDDLFVRWRRQFDLDFILPSLIAPLNRRLPANLLETMRGDRTQAMKVYYHFVADYEHPDKIRETLIVRFYEAVTRFWLCVLAEVTALVLGVGIAAYRLAYGPSPRAWPLLGYVGGVLGVMCLCRIAGYATRRSVRQAAADEIEEIHTHHKSKLDRELKRYCQGRGIGYGGTRD